MKRQIHTNYGKFEGGRMFQCYLLEHRHRVSWFIMPG
jgi:hypothetical protein